MRDILHVASNPDGEAGRCLTATPWEIAVQVTHHGIQYGTIIEEAQGGFVLKCIKQAVFRAVRDAITERSERRS